MMVSCFLFGYMFLFFVKIHSEFKAVVFEAVFFVHEVNLFTGVAGGAD